MIDLVFIHKLRVYHFHPWLPFNRTILLLFELFDFILCQILIIGNANTDSHFKAVLLFTFFVEDDFHFIDSYCLPEIDIDVVEVVDLVNFHQVRGYQAAVASSQLFDNIVCLGAYFFFVSGGQFGKVFEEDIIVNIVFSL